MKSLGRGGEIFILDPPDIPISFIGLRPGEKLHEELMSAEEEVAATQRDRIKVGARTACRRGPTSGCPGPTPASSAATCAPP